MNIRTVHLLKLINDLAQSHSVVLDLTLESGENTVAKSEFLRHVGFSPTIVVEFKLRRDTTVEISTRNVKRIEIGNVVTSNLVGTDQKLNL